MTGSGEVSLDVLILPAFAVDDFELPDDGGGGEEADASDDATTELRRWLDAYDFEREVTVPGANMPVHCTGDGVGVTATGMGKTEAAATVTALLASPALDLSETYFVTAGVAGAPPTVGTLGAVFVADAVVDWDRKHRWADGAGGTDATDEVEIDGTDEADGTDGCDDRGGADETAVSPIDLLKYRPHDYAFRLDEDLVERAVSAGERVDLRDSDAAAEYRRRYDEAVANSTPFVGRGATVCGDEFWHGRPFSEQAEWLVERYDAGVYATTEMEDFGTATALARFGALDRYLSVRGVVNFDRPPEGRSARESLADGGVAIDLGLENVFRVAAEIVADLADRAD